MYKVYDSFEFKEFAQQVSEAISSIVKCDITVIDNAFIRIAGTGQFFSKIGQKLKNNNNFYTAMKKNQKCVISSTKFEISNSEYMFIENPTMGEEVSILIPLVVNGKVLAAIGLSALDRGRMIEIINNYGIYFNFMDKMSDLLSSKLRNIMIDEEVDLLKNSMNFIIDTLDDAVICINMDDEITFINYSVEKFIGMSKSGTIGKNIHDIIKIKEIGNFNNSNMEIDNIYSFIEINHNVIPVLLSIKNMRNDYKVFGKIILLHEISKIKKKNSVIVESEDKFSIDNIVGNSSVIINTKKLIKTISKSSTTVLITGESGTGKELCARAIHSESDRKKSPFIAINCSAIPETLLESELFGYEEGAFSGASKNGRKGMLELADKGTIFLDEIGDMSLKLQAKILRVLQERQVRRIGGNKTIPLDVRIVAATNKDLLKLIDENLFRSDLYYRINVIPISMPSLRERIEDIIVLSNNMLRKYSISLGKDIIGFELETMELMLKYSWPGNVRELENAIEYSCNIETSNLITSESLPGSLKIYKTEINNQIILESKIEPINSLYSLKNNIELDKISSLLKVYGNDLKGKKEVAKQLNIGIATLYRKIKKYNI